MFNNKSETITVGIGGIETGIDDIGLMPKDSTGYFRLKSGFYVHFDDRTMMM